MRRILGIDYGDVRVGLAISDELGMIAQGIDNLIINGSQKKFIAGIKKLKQQYEFEEVVIGYPKNMDGTLSQKAKRIDTLIPELESLKLKVHKWDERLTTVAAYQTMKELKISQKKKKIYADKLAATYILEGYLTQKSRENDTKLE